MGERMSNAPVYFTVAQVRFNTILSMESYLAPIQEKMRTMHFPDYKREHIQRLFVSFAAVPEGEQPPNPAFAQQPRCVFGNIDGTTEFVLENNSLALQTTNYETFEVFSDIFLAGLAIVHDALKLDFTERIGLRYLDAVIPKENETLSNYLTAEVLGLSQKMDDKHVQTFSETVSRDSSAQMISRVLIQNGRVGLPPELMALPPRINQRFTQYAGIHAIIDTDAFTENREAFALERVKERLSSLRDRIGESFDTTITPFARDSWK